MSGSTARTITTSRLLNAPQALVWEAWTDPTRLAEWWGPVGFRNTIKAFEPKVGGRFDLTMHGPDGTDYRNESHFTEFVPRSRLSYRHETAPKFLATATFEAKGEKTLLTMSSLFDTDEAYTSAVEVFGAVKGAEETLQRLAEFVEGRVELTITRQIKAPVDAIWRAWTDPVEWQQWMGPVGWTIADCSIDLRPGGKWSTTQRSPDGTLHPTGGTYLAIEPPHHLAFSWVLEDPEGKVVLDAEHHLRLKPKGNGTEVTLEVRILTALPGSEPFVNGVKQGWTGGLSKLAAFVEG